MRDLINLAFALQASQLVDSRVPTTREFWRKKLGFGDDIAMDPRPLAEALSHSTEKDER